MPLLRSLLVVLALAWPAAWAGSTPSAEQVQQAKDAVAADPLLGSVHKERTLRWKSNDDAHDEKREPERRSDGWPWLIGLVGWLAEAGRALMWLLGALALALVLVLLRRWILERADAVRGKPIALPSHVRDLDIRPESLPDDIAAAARALWLRGEQRASLSLLYRGALSRLVHSHHVPIRAASTEGECVQLAARTLPDDGGHFFERLVRAWLLLVYGAHAPDDAGVLQLCDEFDARLPALVAAPEAA